MVETIHRLEESLCLWEETCLAVGGYARRFKKGLVGPAKHWADFRSYLLKSLNNEEFDTRRFIQAGELEAHMLIGGMFLHYLPQALWSWTRSSRRVYHLSAELIYLLRMTSLEDVTWGDVPWPFESFGIQLDAPIIHPKGWVYDFILVSREKRGDYPSIGFRLCSPPVGDVYKPLSREQKRKLNLLSERGHWDEFGAKMRRRFGKIHNWKGDVFYLDAKDSSTFVTRALEETVDLNFQRELEKLTGMEPVRDFGHWDAAARLVVGFCLYRSMLPTNSSHVSSWRRVERVPSMDPQAVTNEAEVCSVTSIHKFTAEEQEILQGGQGSARAYYEVRAHFREGYWRRKAGTGNDPNAPKVVMVNPTIVRRDRLPVGSLPGGTEKVLS